MGVTFGMDRGRQGVPRLNRRRVGQAPIGSQESGCHILVYVAYDSFESNPIFALAKDLNLANSALNNSVSSMTYSITANDDLTVGTRDANGLNVTGGGARAHFQRRHPSHLTTTF